MSKLGDGKGTLIRCICGGKLVGTIVKKKGIAIHGQKCIKCREVYFPSSQIAKYEMLTGRDVIKRKIRSSGNSFVITVPTQFVKSLKIHENDIAIYQQEKEGFKVKIVCTRK